MKTLIVVLMLLAVGAKAGIQKEIGGAPYVGSQYGSKLKLEVGSSYPLYGFFNADGEEELRLSANMAFPLTAQFSGDVAAGLSLGVPWMQGDLVEAHAGANIIFVSHAPTGGEVFFGFQSKAVVTWFTSLFSGSSGK